MASIQRVHNVAAKRIIASHIVHQIVFAVNVNRDTEQSAIIMFAMNVINVRVAYVVLVHPDILRRVDTVVKPFRIVLLMTTIRTVFVHNVGQVIISTTVNALHLVRPDMSHTIQLATR